jgi:hypothetical protein
MLHTQCPVPAGWPSLASQQVRSVAAPCTVLSCVLGARRRLLHNTHAGHLQQACDKRIYHSSFVNDSRINYVTLLREPVQHTISGFYYTNMLRARENMTLLTVRRYAQLYGNIHTKVRAKGRKAAAHASADAHEPWALHSPSCRHCRMRLTFCTTPMSAVVTGRDPCPDPCVSAAVQMLGGVYLLASVRDEQMPGLLERARQNLYSMAFFGLTDHWYAGARSRA